MAKVFQFLGNGVAYEPVLWRFPPQKLSLAFEFKGPDFLLYRLLYANIRMLSEDRCMLSECLLDFFVGLMRFLMMLKLSCHSQSPSVFCSVSVAINYGAELSKVCEIFKLNHC